MGRLALPVHSYKLSSPPAGSAGLLNCYAEVSPPEGKAPTLITRAPGIVSATAPTPGAGRGLYRFKNRLYAVVGSTLYRVNADHTTELIGTIVGSSVCTFADNSLQLVICDPDGSYIYDGALTRINDPDFGSGIQCAAIDSYVVFIGASGQFFSSDLAAAASYDALNYAIAEGSPDNTIGIIVDHRQVVLAGTDSMEIWDDVGGTGFPFARASNGFLELGCAAGYSLAKADNSVYWLASDKTVRRLEGITPVRVSQHGIETAIEGYTTISDARGFGFTHKGHIWYVLTFPTEGKTWVYDATTREWHERGSYGMTRWRPCATAFAYNRNYVQDYQTGKVGYVDANTYTEWGAIQRMQWAYGSVYDRGRLRFHSELSIRLQAGVGLSTGQGSDPLISLEVSIDGGVTYELVETQSLGRQGERTLNVQWNQLGMSDDQQYRAFVSDPIPVTVTDTQLTVS